MMRISNEPRTYPQNGERLYLKMSGGVDNVFFMDCYQGVILLIDIKVLHKAKTQEVIKVI